MTSFRITERSMGTRTFNNLQLNLARLGELQEQLSSGRLINRPSDSPTGTVSAMQLRGDIRANEQYSRNAQDGIGWLGTIDSTLTSSLDSIRRVRNLTLEGMSTGSSGPQAREALALEIDQIRDGLLNAANTTYLGRPIFGGTTAGDVAYNPDGTYAGDAGTIERTVGDNSRIQVNVTGPEVFGTGANHLFTVLTDISDHLRNDPSALSADLDRLDATTVTMQSTLSEIGARYSRLMEARQAADDRVLSRKTSLSEVESIDLPKTITDLQMQQVAYQAALAATARVIQPSLIDFLR